MEGTRSVSCGLEAGLDAADRRSTGRSLLAAAQRLFAERGVAGTTVRDIARVAGVSERTFLRYYASKEDLICTEGAVRLNTLMNEIRSRPSRETPLQAVHHAVTGTVQGADRTAAATLDAFVLLARSPTSAHLDIAYGNLGLRVETELAEVIFERLTALAEEALSHERDQRIRFQSELLARTAVALLRTVMLFDVNCTRDGRSTGPPVTQLLDRAFTLPAVVDLDSVLSREHLEVHADGG